MPQQYYEASPTGVGYLVLDVILEHGQTRLQMIEMDQSLHQDVNQAIPELDLQGQRQFVQFVAFEDKAKRVFKCNDI